MNKKTISIIAFMTIIYLAAATSAQEVTMTLTGTIVAECDGQQVPLEDVWVKLFLQVSPWSSMTAYTSSDGSYSFTLTVTPDGSNPIADLRAYVPSGYRWVSPTGWMNSVYPGNQTVDFVAECLVPGVSGTVTTTCDGSSQPAAGVTMTLRVSGQDHSTVTASDGSYSFAAEEGWYGGRLSPDVAAPQVSQPRSIYVYLSDGPEVNFNIACLTYFYFEDFESDDGLWEPIDFVREYGSGELEPDNEEDTHWKRTPKDFGDGMGLRGVWWCGTDDECLLATAPGYGSMWNQCLWKEFVLPEAPVGLTLYHRYQTEEEYDFCYVDVSTDGGGSFVTEASFTGDSEGLRNHTIDLLGYAGQNVILRLRFESDGAWDDHDGLFDSAGAWDIEGVVVTGHDPDEFETGPDGWQAEPAPPSTAAFRYDDTGGYWTAADPAEGVVPANSEDYRNKIGIESPWIDLPPDAEQIEWRFCVNVDKFHLSEYHFLSYAVGYEDDSDCIQWVDDNYRYYWSKGVTGWQPNPRMWLPIGGWVPPNTERVKLRLIYNDYNGHPLYYDPDSEVDDNLTHAPYFDNVIVSAVNTTVQAADVPADLECPCACGSGEPPVVSVSGAVIADCLTLLAGFPVDLVLSDGESFSTYTNDAGEYRFEGVPSSTNGGDVSLIAPLGTNITFPEGELQLVNLTEDQTNIDFTLACFEPMGSAEGMGYWKHQAIMHLADKPHGWNESRENMETNFPALIFGHFHENDLNGIAVPDVTFIDDPDGPLPIDLQTIANTFTVGRGGTPLDRAKQHYLALLLNLASLKLTPSYVVSDDEHTASQAIQECAHLILNGDGDDDYNRAKTIAGDINSGNRVASGVIEGVWDDIAYRPGQLPAAGGYMLAQNQPNPFNPMTTIVFAVPTPGRVVITVHDMIGRRMATLANDSFEAGQHRLIWSGTDDQGARLPSGIYFLHMEADEFSASRKMSLLK